MHTVPVSAAIAPLDSVKLISCTYVNETSRIQVIRVTEGVTHYLERTLMPSQAIQFEAPATAQLEIHTSEWMTMILDDVIACDRLRMTTPSILNPKPNTVPPLHKSVLHRSKSPTPESLEGRSASIHVLRELPLSS